MKNPFRFLRSAGRRLYRPSGYAPLPRLDLNEHRRQLARDTALRTNPIGFGPVWKLCLRMGALPIKAYSINKEGEKREDGDHPGYNILRSPSGSGPEARLTRNILIGGTVLNMLTYNRAYWLKVRDSRGKPVELWPMPPTLVSPIKSPDKLISHFELRPIGLASSEDNTTERIPFADVLYFRLLPAPDDWADALAPFEPLAVLLGMGKDAIDAASEYFQTGDLHGGYIETKGRLDPEAVARLEARFEVNRRKRFKYPVLEEGTTLGTRDVGGTADVLISAIDAASKVAADVFGIPDDGDRTRFYAEAIQPIADALEQELERGLFSEWPERPAFPEFGFREILKGDPKDRTEQHARAIMTGQETPDEARRDENRPPIPGGDQLYIPLNLVPIGDTPTSGEPRKKDTAGGMGGEEGRKTMPTAQSGPQATAPGDATRALQDARRYRAKQLRDRWGQGRERLVRGRADQLARQLRGVLGRELRAMRQALRTKRAAEKPLPPLADLEQVIRRHDPDVADRLRGLLADTSEASWAAAAELIDAENRELADDVIRVIDARAEAAAERFGAVRVDSLRRLLDEGIREGWTARELGEGLAQVYEGLEIRYVDGIARTEVAFAHEQAALGAWANAGVTEIEMVFGGGPCSTGVCEEAAGVHRIGEPVGDVGFSFEGTDAPPLHPSCVVAGTFVSGPGAVASVERRYTGQLIQIRTAAGRFLTTTPNHPVLTPEGFIPAGSLHEGSYVLSSPWPEAASRRVPHDHQHPALVEEVARSLGSAGSMTTRTVPMAPEDLHGDGVGSDVYVVRADRLLERRLHSALSKHLLQQELGRGHAPLPNLAGSGGLGPLLERSFAPASGGVRGGGLSAALRIRESAEPQPPGLGSAASDDPSFVQSLRDKTPGAAEFASDLRFAATGLIKADRVLGADVVSTAGQVVYDLQTTHGWYMAGGIVVHNCTCFAVVAIDAELEAEAPAV